MKFRYFFILLILLPTAVFSQGGISGKVVDAATGEPVANATIYIDQTQLSTISDSLGRFRFRTLPVKSSIFITHIGYNKIIVQPSMIKDGMTVSLSPAAILNEDVVVKSKIRDTWEKWGKIFTNYFIGPGLENYCSFLNPYDVRFLYDRKAMKLKAFASKPLKIQNRITGYNTSIDLDSFVYYFADRTIFCSMSEYFEELPVTDEADKPALAANRLLVYRGSALHFARAFYHRSLTTDGFRLYRYIGRINPEKSRVEKLLLQSMSEKDRQAQAETGSTADFSIFEKDTAAYYKTVIGQPDYFFSDSVLLNPESRWNQAAGQQVALYFGGDSLLVKYTGKQSSLPDAVLKKRASMKKAGSFSQSRYDFFQGLAGNETYSLLYLLSGQSLLYRENGAAENSGRLFTEGYFADKKRAFDLPWDYDPAADEQLLITGNSNPENRLQEKLENKMNTIAGSLACTSLYLHLDKTIYDPGENIWFAAYVLHSPFSNEMHNSLYVFLQDEATGRITTTEQFVMNDGLGAGYIYLPDSLPPGNYQLRAYTNTFTKESHPLPFETQLTVRSRRESFTVQADEKLNTYRNDSVYIRCKLLNENKAFADETDIVYRLTADGVIVAKGKTKTNNTGDLTLKGLSLAAVAGKELVLTTDIPRVRDTVHIRSMLTVSGSLCHIRWFPESGELVNGIPARLPFEITGSGNSTANISAVLYEDNDSIATFSTSGPGAGFVNLVPKTGKTYSIRLLTNEYRLADFSFPPVYASGCTIYAEKAVVQDSLRFIIRSTEKNKRLFIAVHQYAPGFYFEKIELRNGEVHINIPAELIPFGIGAITVFDSSGTPLAERSIFREPADQPLLNIETDKTVYEHKSKVQVKLKATDKYGNPVQGILSLSCAAGKRVDINRFRDIAPYGYFSNTIMPANPVSYEYQVIQAERYLLVQGWTHYKWRELDTAKKPALSYGISLVQHGQVLRNGDTLSEAVELALVTPESMQTISTKTNGYFELPPQLITTIADRKITIAVNDKKQKEYQVLLFNDNKQLQQILASRPYFRHPAGVPAIEEEGNSESQLLEEVVVKARSVMESDLYKRRITFFKTNADDCNDWVCAYNYLNCPIHPSGIKPQVGIPYHWYSPNGLTIIYYRGCTTNPERQVSVQPLPAEPFTNSLKGRYYPKEFYVADYEKYNPPVPEIMTTLYWNPHIRTDEKGEASVTFYTNDLDGRFMLIAEGITGNAVLSDKKVFRVGKNR